MLYWDRKRISVEFQKRTFRKKYYLYNIVQVRTVSIWNNLHEIYSIICIQKTEKVVLRRKLVAHTERTQVIVFYLWKRRKCKRRKSTGRVTRRVHVSRCIVFRNWVVESAGASTKVGFTLIYPAVNNFLPQSPPGAITRDSIKS